MKALCSTLLTFLLLTAFGASAQVANDTATQQGILDVLPDGVTAETATADELAQAAVDYTFSLEGDREAIVRQVMVSLGEMNRAGAFPNAPRFGNRNPEARFYNRVLNLASSALDVTYTTYHGVTVQHIIGLTAAMRDGQNFLNGAKSNAITRR